MFCTILASLVWFAGSEAEKRSFSASLTALHRKPDSVEDSHLSGMNVAIHLKRFSTIARDTTLHAGRNFAVAFSCFHETHPEGVAGSLL